MRFLSVCSGVEAASIAWESLGWEALAYAEIEKFPSAVLKHRYPNVPNWGNIERFKEWPDTNFDVLVGGTPCQSFSVAGLRKGLEDPRGNLSLTFCGIAHRYRPKWIIWENVPGVLSHRKNPFGCFLAALSGADAEIRPPLDGWNCAGVVAGPVYGLAWRVLDAQYFGLAQRRKRVFVVGHLGDWRVAASALFEPEGLPGNPPPSRKAGERVAGTLENRAGGGGFGTDFNCGGGGDDSLRSLSEEGRTNPTGKTATPTSRGPSRRTGGASQGRQETPMKPTSVSRRSPGRLGQEGGGGRHDAEGETFVTHSLKAEGFDASEDGTGRGIPLIPTRTDRQTDRQTQYRFKKLDVRG